MDEFHYRGGVLHCEDVPLHEIARGAGTPAYVYSYAALERAYREVEEAFSGLDHLVCFAVKANGNLAVLRALASLGAGADIVSGGELYRAMRAGFDPKKVVFAGVGKTEQELKAGLGERILMFNVESAGELEHLERLAHLHGKRARVALRINPGVDPGTHEHISTGNVESKFGIPADEALSLAERAKGFRCVDLIGVHQHIGSQIVKVAPYVESVERSAALVDELRSRGFDIRYLNIGGGLGIRYRDEETPSPAELVEAIRPTLAASGAKILCEMGRYIAGPAGALLTGVLYRKRSGERSFIVADAGMNDLIRPSLYGAYHEVLPLDEGADQTRADLVGPVCESGDFLARDRDLPDAREGDVLAVMNAGAYGFSMASNYNSRPRPAEVLVREDRWAVVREREHYPDLIRGELVPAFL
ncbi:diaminopimelate decarboxylase [Rubrobacter xylanophilus DSM 9941]|uniref:Diaminopimelate decarboxylase n=1 Tax=Rubrobacter xylanophilus (strain DSM 9941 / JCM 11954 / NBRC 16129 / PRD-1) TaxID=266117 RepID=Q1AZX2_RUBXD|nr:diaminopimelate decarboxylase [Rubrobacter xylanophilus]ABG03056.1 diaminopimelate decarboxylase [Rubrobacter xylanophilus DSM 9941]